jgi:hypothetical protein
MTVTITAFTTTAPLTGYKIADRRCCPTVGPKVPYVVGERYSLRDDETLKLCHRGFHFCLTACDCRATVTWNRGYHLLRVVVPEGVDVQHDGHGKYVARTIVIDADVTSNAAALLTGVGRKLCQSGHLEVACFTNGRLDRAVDDEPACVVRGPGYVEKTWWRHGSCYDGFIGLYGRAILEQQSTFEQILLFRSSQLWLPRTIKPGDPEWDTAKELVVWQESFECAAEVQT